MDTITLTLNIQLPEHLSIVDRKFLAMLMAPEPKAETTTEPVPAKAPITDRAEPRELTPKFDRVKTRKSDDTAAKQFVHGLRFLIARGLAKTYPLRTLLADDACVIGWHDAKYYYVRRSHLDVLIRNLELEVTAAKLVRQLSAARLIVSPSCRPYSYVRIFSGPAEESIPRVDVIRIRRDQIDVDWAA